MHQSRMCRSIVQTSRASLPRPHRLGGLQPVTHKTTQQTTQRRGIRSISRPTPLPSKYNITAARPVLDASPEASIQRRIDSDTLGVRSGVLATKKGMTALYDPMTGVRTACTVLQLDRVQVIAHKTRAKHGYDAVVVGSGWQAARRVNRAMLGVYAHATFENDNGGLVGIAPKQHIREFKVRGEADPKGRPQVPVGHEIKANWWQVGDFVDVKGVTKGKGFAGGMKRWGWGGQPASHGVSLTHRSMGSAGGGQGSGSRVIPGKRMAGNMGHENHTVQNLRVLSVDIDNGIIAVSGSVPGPKKGLVKIVDAVKKPWPAMRDVEQPAPKLDLGAAASNAQQPSISV